MIQAVAIIVTFSVAFAIIMVVIHFFNSCSTNIVDNEGVFDEPSAVGKVQLSDDNDSESCFSFWYSDDSDMSSSHWGAESDPGIERVWCQLCDLQRLIEKPFACSLKQ